MSETGYDKPTSMVVLEELLGQQLPIEFKLFHAAGCSLLRFEREGQVWCFPSPRGLMEQLSEGRINTRYILQLECYASLLKSRTETKAVPMEEGSRMQLSRLRRGLAVADSGGDILFLDPGSDFSVWVFYHDGMVVKKIASSLYEWLLHAAKHMPEAADQHVPKEVLKLCIEDALRDYIRHVLIPRGLVKPEEFLATIAGHTVLNRQEGTIVEKLADLIAGIHWLDPQKDRLQRDRLFDEISRLVK